MIRIPFHIPEPDRSALIAAGISACALSHNQSDATAHRAAQTEVRKVIAIIEQRYGKECVK